MKRLGEILLESGLITPHQLDRALTTAEANRQRLGTALIRIGLVSERDIAQALATQLGLEIVDLRTTSISPDAAELLPTSIIEAYKVIPIRLEGGRLFVATADPTDIELEDILRAVSGHDTTFVIACISDIERWLQQAASPKLGATLLHMGLISAQQLKSALDQAQTTGQGLGEILVAEGLVSEDDMSQAVQAQSVKLGTLLVGAGLLTSDQLERALIVAQASRMRLGEILISMGFVSEATIAHALAHQLGLTTVNLKTTQIPRHVTGLLTRNVAVELGVIPIAIEGKKLLIATADPVNVETEDYLRSITGREIVFAVAPPTDIAWALEGYYPAHLTVVRDQLTQAGLLPPGYPSQPDASSPQSGARPKNHSMSLGYLIEATAQTVADSQKEIGDRRHRRSVRTEFWLLVGLLAGLILVPSTVSVLLRGRLHPLQREAAVIQAAVEAYRTDARVQAAAGSQDIREFPSEWTDLDPGSDLLISMPLLLEAGYLNHIPPSASPANGGKDGHYVWVVDRETGRVKFCHQATLTGSAVRDCQEGHDGKYP